MSNESQPCADILLVEDDETVVRVVEATLREEGHEVRDVATGRAALEQVKRRAPDLLILDLKLPDMDGRDLCRRLRTDASTRDLPILMMTSLDSEADRVRGFEMGADDYLPKPVSYRELALRVRALLRRTLGGEEPAPVTELVRGEIEIDLARRTVQLQGSPLELTSTEYDLLDFLVHNEGRVVSRAELLEQVWGTSRELTTRRVDTYVQRLRSKLGAAGQHIHTHRGAGYRFELPQSKSA
jgi:DNA-binding response OmpR family regulator